MNPTVYEFLVDFSATVFAILTFETSLWAIRRVVSTWALFRLGADAAGKFDTLVENIKKRQWDNALETLTETEIYDMVDKGTTRINQLFRGKS